MTSDVSLPGRRIFVTSALAATVSGCRKQEGPTLVVAAAANLTGVFGQLAPAFTGKTGIRVILSYASTAQLAQQIAHGAPFDLFAAADTEHVDLLVRDGKILPASRAIYARGRLALWVPPASRAAVAKLEDLTSPSLGSVAIAKPEEAPYGEAAVEALEKLGIWERVRPKVVYAGNINMAKQFASTGNADAAFTAYSLVIGEAGRVIVVDAKLYRPIDQALGIVSASGRQAEARRFAAFLIQGAGRSTLARFGYETAADRAPKP